jgi:hypothetical protein
MNAEPTPALLPLLDHLVAAPPQRLGALSLFALVAPWEGPSVATMKEAMDADGLTISELDDAGSVNRVRARNRLDRPILLLDGDELIGAKQNRVLNASVILGPDSVSELDVSCIERGRWRWSSQGFGSEERTVHTTLRSRKAHRVAHSLERTGIFDADQGAVWRDVTTITEARRATSRTAALSDVLEADAERTAKPAESIEPVPGQIGLAAAVGGALLSVDLLGSAELYRRCHRRLVRGLAAEALLHPAQERPTSIDPVALLRAILVGEPMRHRSGAGDEARFHGPEGTAAALFFEGRLVHLAAFPA